MKQSNPRRHNRQHLLLILTFFQLQQVLAVSSRRDWLPSAYIGTLGLACRLPTEDTVCVIWAWASCILSFLRPVHLTLALALTQTQPILPDALDAGRICEFTISV